MIYHPITQQEIVIRILLAIFIGGLLGLERGLKNRPAGLRTYMLVCVGSSLIMMTNQYIYQFTGSGDPMRLGAQVVSGIGFLGAGTIVVTRRNQIKGLTTAAGLWASAGVGLALGIGFYEGAIIAAIGVYLILAILQRLDSRMHKKIRIIELYIELKTSVPFSVFLEKLREMDMKLESVQFETEGGFEANTRALLLTLKSTKPEKHIILQEKIKEIEGVVYLEEL